MSKWVCPVCGYVHIGDSAPEKCPQCGVPGSKFKEEAVSAGKAYVYEAIRTSLRVGPAATVLGMPDPALLRNHPDVRVEEVKEWKK